MASHHAIAWLLLAAMGCRSHASTDASAPVSTAAPESAARDVPRVPPHAAVRAPAAFYHGDSLDNRFAYIPPQCYAHTRDGEGQRRNPCYVCHTRGRPPNYIDDSELQLSWRIPSAAARNPWLNLLQPGAAGAQPDEVWSHVRHSNYFAADGGIVLAHQLADLPSSWDGEGDAHWDGYVPDAYYRFDARGYDVGPDGTRTGWRAIAYRPLPGAFWPSNGSFGDVLMRLDRALYERVDGSSDAWISELNFAIVEALITRRDVAIEPADERALGVDLDLDGQLSVARRVTFDGDAAHTRMRYVGRAGELEQRGEFPIGVGLFPLNSEFLHSLRYLDVQAGRVVAAARLRELRYAKKVRFLRAEDLRLHAASEALEQAESASGARRVRWQFDRGVYNGQGWLLQGFIEDQAGQLRPQSYEESVACVGCHGGIGATTDSMFAFARKLTTPADGYVHWSQYDLASLPEAQAADGAYEYTRYLTLNRAGDDYAANAELSARFYDCRARLRPAALERLHQSMAELLVPSPARALALDAAYLAIVRAQSYVLGRDALLSPPKIHAQLARAERTGLSLE